MVILVDTREQHMLNFPKDVTITSIRRETLPIGDYMVEFSDGTRPPVTFERKSAADLFQTLSKGYERFKAELLRAQDANLSLIVLVEDPLTTLRQGLHYSTRSGESVLQQCFTLMIRYRVPMVFCQDRTEVARYLLEYAKAIGRDYVSRS